MLRRINKKKLILALVIMLLASTAGFLILKIRNNNDNNQIIDNVNINPNQNNSQVEPIPEPEPEPYTFEFDWDREQWKAKNAINKDFIAQIRWESGLVDLPVVQGETNESYLHTDWETMEYSKTGSVFFDSGTIYKNTDRYLEDKNLVIYGHYVYPTLDPDQTMFFSPLQVLRQEENYEDNKYIQLLFEDEVRRYKIATIFNALLEKDDTIVSDATGDLYVYTREDMQYYFPNFDKDYMDTYKRRIKENEYYDTGVYFDENSKLLTIQTCIPWVADTRLIILATEVDRNKLH